MSDQRSTPEPGLYEGVPFEEYLGWDAVSASRLKLAGKSMRHYRAGFQVDETPAMRLGTLVHAGRLEPMSLATRYAVMPDFHLDEGNKDKKGNPSKSKATSYFKEKSDEWRRVNEDKTVVGLSEWCFMLGMVEALSGDELSNWALATGQKEVSLLWHDPETGLLCKARADNLDLQKQIVTDLKKTVDCQRFVYMAKRYEYHVQLAHYQLGIKEVCGITAEPWIVAVEESVPHGVMSAPLDKASLKVGNRLRAQRMRAIRNAQETDQWSGYEHPDSWAIAFDDSPIEVTVGGEKVFI